MKIDLTKAHGTRHLFWRGCRCEMCREADARYYREYRAVNQEKIAASSRRYRKENTEKLIESRSLRHAASRERDNENVRRWAAEHPTRMREYKRRFRAAHPEKVSEEDHRYRKTHRDVKNAVNRARKARKRNADGFHTAADVQAQYERQRGKCFWGRKANPDCAVTLEDGYHVDHVIPLALGGSNGPENIVLACPNCNLRKCAKHPMDFAGVML